MVCNNITAQEYHVFSIQCLVILEATAVKSHFLLCNLKGAKTIRTAQLIKKLLSNHESILFSYFDQHKKKTHMVHTATVVFKIFNRHTVVHHYLIFC